MTLESKDWNNLPKFSITYTYISGLDRIIDQACSPLITKSGSRSLIISGVLEFGAFGG